MERCGGSTTSGRLRRTTARAWRLALILLGGALAACASGGSDSLLPTSTTAAEPSPTSGVAADSQVLADDGEGAEESSSVGAPDRSRASLTGLELPDPAVADRPALAVKIDNVETARPQSGLREADVVYEELVADPAALLTVTE